MHSNSWMMFPLAGAGCFAKVVASKAMTDKKHCMIGVFANVGSYSSYLLRSKVIFEVEIGFLAVYRYSGGPQKLHDE